MYVKVYEKTSIKTIYCSYLSMSYCLLTKYVSAAVEIKYITIKNILEILYVDY